MCQEIWVQKVVLLLLWSHHWKTFALNAQFCGSSSLIHWAVHPESSLFLQCCLCFTAGAQERSSGRLLSPRGSGCLGVAVTLSHRHRRKSHPELFHQGELLFLLSFLWVWPSFHSFCYKSEMESVMSKWNFERVWAREGDTSNSVQSAEARNQLFTPPELGHKMKQCNIFT